jgi:hydrogenase nickel incorporation protein HypA/HybF
MLNSKPIAFDFPMHEYVLADKVLQSALQYMKERGLSSITEVDVDVGDLLGLKGDTLNMAYQILSKGTIAEGSKLRVHRIKGAVVCSGCGFKGGLKEVPHQHSIDPVFACPTCGAPVSIKAGNEVKLNHII